MEAWLALLHAPGVGATRFGDLLARAGDPAALFAASVADLRSWRLSDGLVKWLKAPDLSGVERDLRWAEAARCHLITLHDPAYPELLRRIADPPPILYVTGDPIALGLPQLAMVGSRNPTPPGRMTARDFARFFARSGLAITSGLALGVDAASHEGALAGQGVTLAVTGTGLDRVYPAAHRDLAHRIVEQGALVSEFPVGTPPRPGNFPRRNRIISGLSVGTLVVEATLRSGSLITARLASEQGREVFAIPGSIHNPQARGCHRLIRDGAKLVETAQDVIEELAPLLGGLSPAEGCEGGQFPAARSAEGSSSIDPEYHRLLDAMGHDSATIDLLMQRTGLTSNVISSMLLLLELDGRVVPTPGGGYVRIEPTMPVEGNGE